MRADVRERIEMINRGEVPEGYKKNNKFIIPNEWLYLKLEDFITENRLGGNYENNKEKNETPLIKMGNIGRGYIVLEDLNYITDKEIIECDLLHDGDLLFNTRNTLDLVGKVAIWKNELPRAYYNSNLMKLSFDNHFVENNYFMNYMFNSYFGLKTLRKIATGTTSVAAIYTRDLLSRSLFLPSKKEQQKIAQILSTWDKAIELKEKFIEQKKLQKKDLMKQLLFEKKRLANFEDKWLNVQIKDIASQIVRINKEHEDYVVLSCTKHKGLVESLKYFGKQIFSEDVCKRQNINVLTKGILGIMSICNLYI